MKTNIWFKWNIKAYASEIKSTFLGPQQRQKFTSRVEPGFTQIGVLRGKNIENLQIEENKS
jgi:hypothetical protein